MQERKGARQRRFCTDSLRLPEISSGPRLRGQMKQLPALPPFLRPAAAPVMCLLETCCGMSPFRMCSHDKGREGGREGTHLLASLLSAEVFSQPESTDKLRLEKTTRNRKQNWKDLTRSPSPSPRSKVGSNLHLPRSCSPGLTCLQNSLDGTGRDYPDL